MADWISIGKVVSVNYARRELRIAPFTRHPEQFSDLGEIRVVLKNGTEIVFEAETTRNAGRNVCVRVGETPSLDAIDELKNARIVVAPDKRLQLPAGEYYDDELIGLNVRDTHGVGLGTLTAIYPMTSHHDVYEVTAEDGVEYLVAAVESAVLDVDVTAGNITVETDALVRQVGHAH